MCKCEVENFFTVVTITSRVATSNAYESISSLWEHRRSPCLFCNFICLLMSFWNPNKSSSWSYSSSVSSSSSELDVEQSSTSAKIISVLSKPDPLVWETGPSNFSRLVDFTYSSFWTLDCSSGSWSVCIDDDEIFSRIFNDNLLSLLEPYICSNAFQRRFAVSSKSYSISISSFIFALKALDKALDA
jgi:hypothetical protein